MIHPQEQILEVFNNKAKDGVEFDLIEHDEVLILEEGKLRSRKREQALPLAVELSCLKGIDQISFIDEGLYPRVKRQFQKLDKGDKSSFRVVGPFCVFCQDLLELKFEVNGKKLVRVKMAQVLTDSISLSKALTYTPPPSKPPFSNHR